MRLFSPSFLLVWLLFIATSLHAEPPAKASTYRMEPITDFDATPYRTDFVITGPDAKKASYRTVEAVKQFIATLPKGVTLQWAPSDIGTGHEITPQQISEIKKHCEEKGILFDVDEAG